MTLFATDLRQAPPPSELDAALAHLEQEAHEHPGVQHPWLAQLGRGAYRDLDGALQGFAREYHGYLSGFASYLECAMFRLPNPLQQMPWQRRLAKELGYLGEDGRQQLRRVGISTRVVEGTPRAALFRRFAEAVGVADDELAEPSAAAAQWRDRLLDYLRDATAAEAFGALALGTECVDRQVHTPLLRCLLGLGTLRRDEFVAIELLCLAEEEHLQDLRNVAKELAAAPGGLDELRSGMHTALDLRREFHDRLCVLTMASM